jgi:hypothetical protein
LVDPGIFQSKSGDLGELIKIFSKKYPAAKPKGDAALAAVKAVQKFAAKRNELIHSTPDSLLNGLTYKQASVDIDLKRIQSLSENVLHLDALLMRTCGDFLVDFSTIRDPDYPKRVGRPRRRKSGTTASKS